MRRYCQQPGCLDLKGYRKTGPAFRYEAPRSKTFGGFGGGGNFPGISEAIFGEGTGKTGARAGRSRHRFMPFISRFLHINGSQNALDIKGKSI